MSSIKFVRINNAYIYPYNETMLITIKLDNKWTCFETKGNIVAAIARYNTLDLPGGGTKSFYLNRKRILHNKSGSPFAHLNSAQLLTEGDINAEEEDD